MTATILALSPRAGPEGDSVAATYISTTAAAPIEVERAAALLLRGARCFSELATDGALADPWPTNATAGVRARYVANCLRELDTFLKGLLDEVAPSPLGRPRRHNAANRMHDVAQRPAMPSHVMHRPAIVAGDVDRLRALGRSRACLWHCHGVVRRPDLHGGAWMTAGWHAPTSAQLRRYALGERLAPSGRDLVGVGAFYHQLARKVITA